MLVFILLWILYCITEGYEDAWYPQTNHWRATLRRIATGLIIVYAACGVGTDWVLYINTGFLLASVFLVFFTIAHNLTRSQPWHYIGATASWDKLMRKAPKQVVWGAYFFLMLLAIIVQLYNARYIVLAEPLINTTWLF